MGLFGAPAPSNPDTSHVAGVAGVIGKRYVDDADRAEVVCGGRLTVGR